MALLRLLHGVGRRATNRCQHANCRSVSTLSSTNPFLKVSEEVRAAVHAKQPVVALETTIYTHGFPHPQNVALAAELEDIVRQGGAVPATIGILDGIARVGMTPNELQRLTDPRTDVKVLKVSRRDLAFAIGSRLAGHTFHGGTTIAGTSVLAHLAGIRIFATGGLGGVHRGAETSMDISADLTELGRTPITVISSGCKSFLDIPRTMEYLETEGVTVATFADGREGYVDFPAFWARDSGVTSPMTLRDECHAAAVVHAQTELGLTSGLLFANPIPANAAIPKSEIDVVIAEAVRVANDKGVNGKDNTPFILDWILKATDGKSIVANRALISSNVRRGTRVAVELAQMEATDSRPLSSQYSGLSGSKQRAPEPVTSHPPPTNEAAQKAEVLVAGAVAIDTSCDYTPFELDEHEPRPYTSNPAAITQTIGGVGYNIAKTLHQFGVPVAFCSVVGNDLSGKAVREGIQAEGLRSDSLISCNGATTAQYIAVNDVRKSLHVAMADMRICEDEVCQADLKERVDHMAAHARWAVLDANLSSTALRDLADLARQRGAKVALEPVSVPKASRATHAMRDVTDTATSQWRIWPRQVLDLVSPNAMELAAIYNKLDALGAFESQQWFLIVDALGIPTGSTQALKQIMPAHLVDQGVPQQAIKLLPLVPCVVAKLGPDGVLLVQLLTRHDQRLRSGDSARFILGRGLDDEHNGSGVGGVYIRHYPAAEDVAPQDVVNVNGVGDTLLGTLIAGLTKHHGQRGVEDFIDVAQQAAVLTLKCKESVNPSIRSLKL